MKLYLQKAAFLALVALLTSCSKEDSEENTPDVSDVLLSVEVDPGYYDENTKEWFYLSTPEGKLLTVPILAENGKINQIRRPEGFLEKDFQLNILKAAKTPNAEEFTSHVYTHFDVEKVFRKKANAQKLSTTQFALHIIRKEYLPNEDFFISTSSGLFAVLRSSMYEPGLAEVTTDFRMYDKDGEEFYVFYKPSGDRSGEYFYHPLQRVKGQLDYSIRVEDFIKAESFYEVSSEEAAHMSYSFSGHKNGHYYNLLSHSFNLTGEPLKMFYPEVGFSNFTYRAHWRKAGMENITYYQLGQGIPEQKLMIKEFAGSIDVSSLTDFTYDIRQQADFILTVKSFFEPSSVGFEEVKQYIYSPGDIERFTISPIPDTLLEAYPFLKKYTNMKHSYTDFRDYKKVGTYSDYLHIQFIPEISEENDFWVKYGGVTGQSISN